MIPTLREIRAATTDNIPSSFRESRVQKYPVPISAVAWRTHERRCLARGPAGSFHHAQVEPTPAGPCCGTYPLKLPTQPPWEVHHPVSSARLSFPALDNCANARAWVAL